MNTGMLASLREQNEAAKLMQDMNFSKLDVTLQVFVARLSQGEAEASDLIKAESATTRALVLKTNHALSSQIESLDISRQRVQLTNSLRFPETNARLNQIEDASPNTFDIFFEPSSDHTLAKWLRDSHGMLWIRGKAGSGKSTLMKFIAQSPKVTDLVGNKSPGFAMLSHFFWLSGGLPQRDFHGMLCSLAYQLAKLAKLDNEILYGDKMHPNDWSSKELEQLVLSSLKTLATKSLIVILLDALDEYDSQCDQRKLLNYIIELSHHAKVCVSSRPEPFWVKHLPYSSHVKLEDITKRSIESFIGQKFMTAGFGDSDQLISQLALHAEGIFLWAHIAVRDVLRGLDSSASKEELQKRIQRLPQGIENLYAEMIGRMKDDWPLIQQEAAIFFSTALLLSQVSGYGDFAEQGFLHHYNTAMKTVLPHDDSRQELGIWEQECTRLKDRIPYVCAGMLEVRTHGHSSHSFLYPPRSKLTASMCFREVEFTHRTARDFLVDVPFGRRLTQSDVWDVASVVCGLVRAEHLLSTFGKRKLDWQSIDGILSGIQMLRQDRDLNDADYQKMVSAVREILKTLASFKPALSSQPIEYIHKSQLFKSTNDSSRGFSIDFLGLTLECGITCYFTSGCLQLENLDSQYLEYILLCAASACQRSSIFRRPGKRVFARMKNILGQYRACGTQGFWVRRSSADYSKKCKLTADGLFFENIMLYLLGVPKEYASEILQELLDGNLNAADLRSFGFRFDSAARQFLTSVTEERADVWFYVEGNLKFWLSCIHSDIDLSQHEELLNQIEGYRDVVPFRRIFFVAQPESGYGVPMTNDADGEVLLQLWGSSIRRPRTSPFPLLSEQDRTNMKRETDRLLRTNHSWSNPGGVRGSCAIDGTEEDQKHLIHIVDYLKSIGLLRDDDGVHMTIPVFKEP